MAAGRWVRHERHEAPPRRPGPHQRRRPRPDPLAAHADTKGPTIEGQPVTKRITDIANHPGQAVDDTKTALAVTASAAGSATHATDTSLAGAGNAIDGLPKAPSVR